LDNVNLNLLRALYVLIDECHVSRAATRLHLTQSAVSRQLAQCRELFADPLLIRQGNQLVATRRATQLHEQIGAILLNVDQVLQLDRFEPEKWRGELVFASSDYVAQYVLPDLLEPITLQAPLARVHYKLWQPELLERFHLSGIDLASTMLPAAPKGLSSQQIGEDHSVCVMAKSHPLSQFSSISCQQLSHYAHIKVTGGGDKDSAVDMALTQAGYQRHISLKVPFFSAAMNRLCRSDCLMVIPEHIAHNLAKTMDICYRPLEMAMDKHKYWLIWQPKFDHDPIHQWLRQQILQAMQGSMYSIHITSHDFKS